MKRLICLLLMLALALPCAAMAQAETGDSAGIPQYLCRMAQEMKRIAALELEHS